MPPVQCHLLRYPEEAPAIERAFADLERVIGGGCLYQSHRWFQHNADNDRQLGGVDCRVLRIGVGGTTEAVIPLRTLVEPLGPLRIPALEVPWLMSEASAVQFGPNLQFAATLPLMLDTLAREWLGWDVLIWRKQITLSSARLPPGVSFRRRWVSAQAGASFKIPVPSRPEEITNRLSTKARAGLRNARNRLRDHQAVFRCHQTPGPAATAALEAVLTLEGAGWKALDQTRWPHYVALMSSALAEGAGRIYTLEVDGALAAGLLALSGPPNRLAIYKIAYSEPMARLSPGRLLLFHVLEEASRLGLAEELDMMSPSPWLSPWSPIPDPVQSLWCFRASLRGLSGFLIAAAGASARRVIRPRPPVATA